MTKQELIDRVFRKHGLPRGLTKKAIAEIVDGVFAELSAYFVDSDIDGQGTPRFTYPGFGTFSKRRRPARTLRHPRTGDPVDVPASDTLAFSVGSDLKSLLNGKG